MTALEAGKSKIKVPEDLVAGESWYLLLRWNIIVVFSCGRRARQGEIEEEREKTYHFITV
jgi:hypothetical protein